MIKILGEKDGKPLFIFGLSRGNCQRLLLGHPIVIDLDVMMMRREGRGRGGLYGAVVLTGGETESAIIGRLEEEGIELPEPIVDPDLP